MPRNSRLLESNDYSTDLTKTKRIQCIKRFMRDNMNSIVPNSIDEDLSLGSDAFLKINPSLIMQNKKLLVTR
jgi:hypothetical protein